MVTVTAGIERGFNVPDDENRKAAASVVLMPTDSKWTICFGTQIGQLMESTSGVFSFQEMSALAAELLSSRLCAELASSAFCPANSNPELVESYERHYKDGQRHFVGVPASSLLRQSGQKDYVTFGGLEVLVDYCRSAITLSSCTFDFATATQLASFVLSMPNIATDYYVSYLRLFPANAWDNNGLQKRYSRYLYWGGKNISHITSRRLLPPQEVIFSQKWQSLVEREADYWVRAQEQTLRESQLSQRILAMEAQQRELDEETLALLGQMESLEKREAALAAREAAIQPKEDELNRKEEMLKRIRQNLSPNQIRRAQQNKAWAHIQITGRKEGVPANQR